MKFNYLLKGVNEKQEGVESFKNALNLFQQVNLVNLIPTLSISNGLKLIHNFIFNDLHINCGKFRNVNISKSGFMFAPWNNIEASLKSLENVNFQNIDNILNAYVELNVLHPFREGNGRVLRIWLDIMLRFHHNLIVNWQVIPKDMYMNYMVISPYESKFIIKLLRDNLTKDLNDIKTFKNNLKQSFSYENITI